jgi:hypothetical protein
MLLALHHNIILLLLQCELTRKKHRGTEEEREGRNPRLVLLSCRIALLMAGGTAILSLSDLSIGNIVAFSHACHGEGPALKQIMRILHQCFMLYDYFIHYIDCLSAGRLEP